LLINTICGYKTFFCCGELIELDRKQYCSQSWDENRSGLVENKLVLASLGLDHQQILTSTSVADLERQAQLV
jgi:hypothetical protein